MSSVNIMNETLSIDLVNSSIGIITGIISFLTAACALYKLLKKRLNSFPKYQRKLFKKAKIKTWKMSLFSIKISLDELPIITKSDKVLSSLLICLAITGMSVSGYFLYKISLIPENWAALTLNSSKEDFLITYGKATSFDRKQAWTIDNEKCLKISAVNFAMANNTSKNLAEVVCEMVSKKNQNPEVEKAIKNTKDVKVIYFIFFPILKLQLLWLVINAYLTLLYKRKLRRVIISEYNRSFQYLT